MPQQPPILSVQGLSLSFLRYGRGLRREPLQVIQDLNLQIRPGEIVAVIGASGSGKSLLAHAILGLLPGNSQLSGAIHFAGEPLTPARLKKLRGRDLVLVPQSISYLDPLMPIGPQLRNGRRGEAAKQQARDVLARYGLDPSLEKAYPFQLSGGMARRVLLGTSAMAQPRLIIADEPTPGLHPAVARRVLGHFRELADGGAGVLVITHDLESALGVADRVAVFYAGTILEEALPQDFRQPETLRHPYTKALWRALPSGGFQPLPGAPPFAAQWQGCPFSPRCADTLPACAGKIPWRQIRGGYTRCIREEAAV